jgi:hypothetical protein
MRIKSWTYTVIAASLIQFAPLAAQAESPTQLEQGGDLLVAGLKSLVADPASSSTAVDVSSMMKKLVVGFRSQLGECVNPHFSSIVECLRGTDQDGYTGGVTTKYLDAAVKSGKIDTVERALLARYFSAVTDVTGNTVDGVTVGSAPLMPEPTGKGLAQPSLPAYRQNKIDYAALRVAKKMEAVLPADLAAQMAKAFPRKMNGVPGNLTAEEFFASLPGDFGRLQLNQLAALMVSATDLMTRPDAEVVSYPADYAFTSKSIKNLQAQAAQTSDDIKTAPDAATVKQYQALLSTLLAQINALQQKDPILALNDQRGQLSAALAADEAKIASCTPSDSDCAAALADVDVKKAAITSIDNQLGDLIRTNELAPTDIQRFAVNVLRADLKALSQNAPFSGLNLQIGDVLMSAWVSGDISSDALRALAQMSNLKETHISVWKKALSITWGVAQTSLMAFPTTSYIAIGISIFLQIRQESAAANAAKSQETDLIPAGGVN